MLVFIYRMSIYTNLQGPPHHQHEVVENGWEGST